MQGVAVGDPSNEAAGWGERDDSVARDGQVTLGRRPVVGLRVSSTMFNLL